MKILKILPKRDSRKPYNYQINYGVWEEISGEVEILEDFNKNLNDYDIVFLPMYKRWTGHLKLLKEIKEHKIKTILFDNDCYHRSFNDQFYKDLDFIFYRMLDKNKETPKVNNHLLKWSINTDLYTPVYGGNRVSFNCGINKLYNLRLQAAKVIKKTSYSGHQYIDHLQKCAGAIHIDSHLIKVVQAKILEFAACGTQIISNRTSNMNDYFPDNLITYFDTIEELKQIYDNFKPNIKIQKQLREICVDKQSNKVRAKEILEKIS